MPSFFYHDLKKFDKNLEVEGKEYHHISQVMRRKEGDNLTITSGKGLLANALITKISSKKIFLEINHIEEMKRSQPSIAIGFALLKNKHDHLIIEKCTELGCSRFYPIETERTIRKSNFNQISKFQKIAQAAIKQSDNAWLPEIAECLKFEVMLKTVKEDGYLPVVCLETGTDCHLLDFMEDQEKRNICVIIGPEGGFSTSEIEYLEKLKIKAVSLGNHILRSETAAITAVALTAGKMYCNNKDHF